MRFLVGTSGYSYKEWKGHFYPEKLPEKQMLAYYGERFSTVEINNTFYRLPKADVLKSWAAQVPENFRFVLKVSQKITHMKRLQNVEDETSYLLRTASVLEARLGPLLFQLPPNMKKDLPRLGAFLNFMGDERKAVFEFRHESWLDSEVLDCLRTHTCALCCADMEDGACSDLVSTAGWGYVRLRREDYTDDDLRKWIERLRAQPWDEAYVFFKHEDAGAGPKLAARFLELAGS
jgi:uncharacterized protein YecE (DUF72 family)